MFYDLDQTPIFGFHLFPQYHSRFDIYRHKICQNVNTRNPSYSKLVFYFQQISPIIIIWEWFSSVIHSSIKIIKILYSVSTCQPMCSQSQFVFYFEPKTPKPLWFKMMNWQPLAVLHHGILWTLHNIKILIFTGTNRNREPVLSSFGWEKFLVHIQNRLEQKVRPALIHAKLWF